MYLKKMYIRNYKTWCIFYNEITVYGKCKRLDFYSVYNW